MFQAMDRGRVSIFVTVCVASGLLLGLPATGAMASGVVFDAGFEAPAYTTTGGTLGGGVLQGQAGWLWDGSLFDPSLHSTAVVQDSVFESGSQAVLVTRKALSDRHWAMPKTGLPTQRFIAIDWDMRVAAAPDSDGYGPVFGVDSNDRLPNGTARVLGSLGVDSSTGEVLYQQPHTGFFLSTNTLVGFDEWNHYRLVLDFATDSYQGFLNGVHVVSSPFIDDSTAQELDKFSDADIYATAGEADAVSQNLSSTAVFDNFLVRDGQLGDYDLDGDVDDGDYSRWRMTFGQTVSVPGNLADGNKNGIVDAADYVIWRDNLGASLFSGTSSGLGLASSVVPEPGALALGSLAISAVAFFTRRR